MPKAKGRTESAAQRREQVREQRQQRLNTSQNTQARSRGRSPRKRKASGNPWLMVGILVAVVAVVVGIFFVVSNQSKASKQAATPDVFKSLTSIEPSVLSSVGGGSVSSNMLTHVQSTPIWTGADGKPVIFYDGAEYCPFCAAQRWGMIVAVSRFGTFSQPLTPLVSGEDSIPTYTFHDMKYTSQYIDFTPVESGDNTPPPSTKAFEQLTPLQQQVVSKYDASPYMQNSGSIPFISIANQWVSSGAYYDPTILSSLSYQQIVTQIKDPTTDVSKGILGSANYLTSAICAVTQNQPASVCNSGSIPPIQQSLPKTFVGPGGPQLGSAIAQLDMDLPR